jgi:hypothetical protein
MKTVEIVIRGGRYMRRNHMGSDFNQDIFYAYMEIPQSNPFIQLIYTNKK